MKKNTRRRRRKKKNEYLHLRMRLFQLLNSIKREKGREEGGDEKGEQCIDETFVQISMVQNTTTASMQFYQCIYDKCIQSTFPPKIKIAQLCFKCRVSKQIMSDLVLSLTVSPGENNTDPW